jgi:c-di-GMP-binding flagellar brake protein YcgR
VPASRSRTERWRDCLRQVHERDGALEVSIPTARPQAPDAQAGWPPADLIWRVRILSLSETEILVEQPSAAGAFIDLQSGVRLIAVMAIGQNRWMFHTRVLGPGSGGGRTGPTRTVRLAMPTTVERCQRRNFFRISTAELSLPLVECWSLLDPTSVGPAEVANRAHILELLDSGPAAAAKPADEPVILPEVGPKFAARLMNIGGGGAGLILNPSESQAIDRARLYWMRVHLMPHIPAPIGITARLVHTHVDSTQSVYVGMAFEWSFNAAHRDFVVEQICRCVSAIQREQAIQIRTAA